MKNFGSPWIDRKPPRLICHFDKPLKLAADNEQFGNLFFVQSFDISNNLNMSYKQSTSFKLFILLLGIVSGNRNIFQQEILRSSAFISSIVPNSHDCFTHSQISVLSRPHSSRLNPRFLPSQFCLTMASKDMGSSIKAQQLAARLKTLKVGELRQLFDQVRCFLNALFLLKLWDSVLSEALQYIMSRNFP